MSHYICNDENCLAKKFIAFKNAEELRLHRLQIHDKQYTNKKIDIKELCGFQYEGHSLDD
jgi:SUMO ligase MMS21 Smc5/6 complex component